MADFCGHAHPVLAVPCATCRAKPGGWCKRPSGHRASDFHQSRKDLADALFIRQHGPDASIERSATGWVIDPTGYRRARAGGNDGGDVLPLFEQVRAAG